jgi:enoyl-CoA hydratase/carnithine racemase
MLHETHHHRLETDGAVAILWLEFPGEPVNALSPTRLIEIDRAISVVEANPQFEVLVIRSGRPAGFCGGHDPLALTSLTTDADRAAFARSGQRVLARLAASPLVTVSFLQGPCRGPGLELALACDYRLAVSGPEAWLGFAAIPPCWGGSARLRQLLGRRSDQFFEAGGPLTAREAHCLGLVDDAVSDRRAKIELQLFLDRLLARPRKRWRDPNPPGLGVELARERTAFRAAGPWSLLPTRSGPFPLPGRATITGPGPGPARLAVELVLRGVELEVDSNPHHATVLAGAVDRGRITPLEADQARGRLKSSVSTGFPDLVVWTEPGSGPTPLDADLPPRTILALPGESRDDDSLHPQRIVGLELDNDGPVTILANPETSAETVATLRGWLERLGLPVRVVNQVARGQLRSAA